MQIIQAILLGALQGLTEFIPVSSSGHLILMDQLFHLSVSGFVFDAVLNIGTLAALLIYFYQDWIRLLSSIWRGGEVRKLLGLIILATVPGVIAGIFLQEAAENVLRSSYIVVCMLILVGIAMLVVEKYPQRSRKLDSINLEDAIIVGLAQVLAFLPGTSRSGVTIVAGSARGLSREATSQIGNEIIFRALIPTSNKRPFTK